MALFFILWFLCGIFSGIITLHYFEKHRHLYRFSPKLKFYLFGFLLGPIPVAFNLAKLIILLTIHRIKRPKWQHSNLKKSIEAVQKISNQDLLIKIIHDHKSRSEVQIEAVKKISNEYVLRDKVLLSGLYFIIDSMHNTETRIFCKDYLKPNQQDTPSYQWYSFDSICHETNPSVDYYDGVSLKARLTALNGISDDIQLEILMMFGKHWNYHSPFKQFFQEIILNILDRIGDEEILELCVISHTHDLFKDIAILRMGKETSFLLLSKLVKTEGDVGNLQEIKRKIGDPPPGYGGILSDLYTYSIGALGDTRDDRAIPILLETLCDVSLEYWEGKYFGETRHKGANALVKFGEKAKELLLLASQSDNHNKRKWAQWILEERLNERIKS